VTNRASDSTINNKVPKQFSASNDPVIKSQQAMCPYVSNPLLISEFKLKV